METGKGKQYSAEFKAQILKEIRETKNMALVARTHGIVYHTVAGWVLRERRVPAKKRDREQKEMETRLAKLELENRILKELLKKTNQAWLSEDPSPSPSLRRET